MGINFQDSLLEDTHLKFEVICTHANGICAPPYAETEPDTSHNSERILYHLMYI